MIGWVIDIRVESYKFWLIWSSLYHLYMKQRDIYVPKAALLTWMQDTTNVPLSL